MKTAVVTGASSGIGFQVCRIFLEKGYRVYGISRRGTVPEGVMGISADVSDEKSVQSAIDTAASETGRIDILINCAGMGISGPVEFADETDVRRIMNVNFLGQFFCAKAVLKYMRAERSGSIVFVSSVAAPIAIPYQAFYSTSKAAVSDLALSLRNEVKDFGIKVCVVMPGDVSTGFTAAREKQTAGADIYTHCSDSVAIMEHDEQSGMPARNVAEVIVKAAEKSNPKPLYTAGNKYKFFYLLIKLLPARLIYWLVGKMY